MSVPEQETHVQRRSCRMGGDFGNSKECSKTGTSWVRVGYHQRRAQMDERWRLASDGRARRPGRNGDLVLGQCVQTGKT